MMDLKIPSTSDPDEPAAEEEGQNGQPNSKLDILGESVGDAVGIGEVCSAGLDIAGSVIGGILDGI